VDISEFIKSRLSINGKFLIPTLQDIQEEYRYLPEEGMSIVAENLKIPLRDVYGVASFYSAFSFTPKGEHIITVCMGTACHVRGGVKIANILKKILGIKPGETTPDMKFSLETVNCLGACALGPVMVVDGEYFGQMTPLKVSEVLKNFSESAECERV